MPDPSHIHLAGPGPESTRVSSPATAIRLPEPQSGRLAELLAGARSPGQPYELWDEPGFRASYILVALTWSSVRRRSARTLLGVALSSVRSLLPSSPLPAVGMRHTRQAPLLVGSGQRQHYRGCDGSNDIDDHGDQQAL
jgi:hypothetical protein